MPKHESVTLSVRMPKRVHDYYTGLAEDYAKRWHDEKRSGYPPTRNWFMVQAMALRAGIEEAVDWKDDD